MKYFIGIDLGTSRTSIATSTGKRATIRSLVGYPKDLISQKRIGVPYLVGDEALENRLALNMVQPIKDGVIDSNNSQALEATKLIIQTVIDKALPKRKIGDEIYAAIGAPAKCSSSNKKDILNITKGFINKVLLVSEPFAVAYGLDMFDEAMIVDMGGGTVDLVRIRGSFPTEEDEMTLTTGGDFLDEKLSTGILAKFPNVQLTKEIVKKIKEKYGYVSNSADCVEVELTEKGIKATYDITDVLRDSCLKFTDPICSAIQELVGDFDPEFQEKLRNNIILAGGGSRLRGLDRAVEKSLEKYGGGSAETIQDAEYGGAEGALRLAMECPENMWEDIK